MPQTIAPTRRILITAGPTHEPIDPVRYLANRSSGRMGLALAEAAADRQWPVTLLLGPTPLPPPERSMIRTLRFQSTDELGQLLADLWADHDILVMAAAVADFRPAAPVVESPNARARAALSAFSRLERRRGCRLRAMRPV